MVCTEKRFFTISMQKFFILSQQFLFRFSTILSWLHKTSTFADGCYTVFIQLLQLLYFRQSHGLCGKILEKRMLEEKKQTVIEILSVAIADSFSVNTRKLYSIVYLFCCSIFFISFCRVIIFCHTRARKSYREKLYSIFHKHRRFIIFPHFFFALSASCIS